MHSISRTSEEDSFAIAAIDVHAHFGNYVRDGLPELNCRFMSGDAACVVDRARAANIALTVASPLAGLLPRGRPDAVAANEEAARIVDETPGLRQWVIVHPDQPATLRQARERSRHPRCAGIKIHPEEHCYPIAAAGAPIFELAAELGAVILTHSGESNSIPLDFVPLADRFPEVRLILAHLGNSGSTGAAFDLQVRAIQASKHGNVYVDTSSIRSMASGLIEWAVDEVGADRILFGTDTPLYFAGSQRARIDLAEISIEAKRLILRDNALRLLPLVDDPGDTADLLTASSTLDRKA